MEQGQFCNTELSFQGLSLAAEAAVLDGFGDVGGFDGVKAGHVGDGAGYLVNSCLIS